MRLILTHVTRGQQDYERIEVEGENYETLYAEAMKQIPDGRFGAHVMVER